MAFCTCKKAIVLAIPFLAPPSVCAGPVLSPSPHPAIFSALPVCSVPHCNTVNLVSPQHYIQWRKTMPLWFIIATASKTLLMKKKKTVIHWRCMILQKAAFLKYCIKKFFALWKFSTLSPRLFTPALMFYSTCSACKIQCCCNIFPPKLKLNNLMNYLCFCAFVARQLPKLLIKFKLWVIKTSQRTWQTCTTVPCKHH